MCCRYVALPIETPENRQDYDDIRWYLLHGGISVFIEDDAWFINIQTNCRHLLPDQRCGIYHTRPKICRDYTTDNCDYHSGDYGWEAHFTAPEHLEEYYRLHHAGKNGTASPRKGRRPGRPGTRVRRRRRSPIVYTRAKADLGGMPLPVLRNA